MSAAETMPAPFRTQLCGLFFPTWLIVLIFLTFASSANAQPGTRSRQFHPGSVNRIQDIPTGRFRSRLEGLQPAAQVRALGWLRNFHFTELDLDSLHADAEGGIFYADDFTIEQTPTVSQTEPVLAQAAVPVSPFPAGLVFHSKPGAPNVLFLNFAGENVTGTAWNTSLGRTTIPAVAFGTDSDFNTFSDSEQTAIKRIWERVAEDYAPFNVDVTTERPVTFGTRTAHALITRNTDANGNDNPSPSAGGVAYVDVFATSSYATYRPGWIYFNNLGNTESYIAEAVTHEMGHNMGLSHDGTTGGDAYYGGHGSGNISWGPIMGTGYGQNVSQWSKGEYYLANNTEDDLAILAGKLSYRTDDCGNTIATATPLAITGGTNIVSTTPETDPAKTNSTNKGILESNTDVDVFYFATGTGPIRLAVNPWIMPAGTRGGNLDVLIELRDAAGTLLLTNNPATDTVALIQTNLTDGQYYLFVKNSGAGNPTSSTPTGYTPYGSIGQYFISGYVVPSSYVTAPIASLLVTNITQPGLASQPFTVTYSGTIAINVLTMGNQNLRITGPNGYNATAQFISLDVTSNGTPRTATYNAIPPNGIAWLPGDDGTYTVWMQTNQIANIGGAYVAAGQLGQFSAAVPTVAFAAYMDSDPGWTLEPLWQFGHPTYASSGPTNGFTGTNILGYNLAGNYENNLTTKYATTPAINCSAFSSLSLRFQRWLRLKISDTALIEVSTNGSNLTTVWSTTLTVADSAWQQVQYTLPAWTTGSPSVQLRWGISSGSSLNDIGWNLDDVEIFGMPQQIPATVQLVVDVNNAAWGTVSPTNETHASGSSVQVLATPATYYRFNAWSGDVSSTNNPLPLVLNSNTSIQGVFEELFTTNYPTPLWWLAANGYTNNFETVVGTLGANGMPLWQSYIAGLNPTNPASQLTLSLLQGDEANWILQWNTVTGRVYTVWESTNLISGFTALPGAVNLPATIQSITNSAPASPSARFFRLEVQKP